MKINHMCDCQSYNRPDVGGNTRPTVITDPFTSKAVCVDACIVEYVRSLWKADIPTLGSCCGHNGALGEPSIIVDDSDSANAVNIVPPHIKIKVWRLVDVN